jgi:hypothetical protein
LPTELVINVANIQAFQAVIVRRLLVVCVASAARAFETSSRNNCVTSQKIHVQSEFMDPRLAQGNVVGPLNIPEVNSAHLLQPYMT